MPGIVSGAVEESLDRPARGLSKITTSRPAARPCSTCGADKEFEHRTAGRLFQCIAGHVTGPQHAVLSSSTTAARSARPPYGSFNLK